MGSEAAIAFVRCVRLAMGLSQGQIAQIIDMSLRQFSRFETGASIDLKGVDIARTSRALGIPAEIIFELLASYTLTAADGTRLATEWIEQMRQHPTPDGPFILSPAIADAIRHIHENVPPRDEGVPATQGPFHNQREADQAVTTDEYRRRAELAESKLQGLARQLQSMQQALEIEHQPLREVLNKKI